MTLCQKHVITAVSIIPLFVQDHDDGLRPGRSRLHHHDRQDCRTSMVHFVMVFYSLCSLLICCVPNDLITQNCVVSASCRYWLYEVESPVDDEDDEDDDE